MPCCLVLSVPSISQTKMKNPLEAGFLGDL
nr:MAG TPA: hypothetical protein [Bacteriophage sp.]